MSSVPDWLAERVALDEAAAHRARIARTDPRELAEHVAALRDDNARELAAHPAGPAAAELATRVAAEQRRLAARRQRAAWRGLAIAAGGAACVLVAVLAVHRGTAERAGGPRADDTRVKGAARLIAYRQHGDSADELAPDTVVRAGDVIQLRYRSGGRRYGIIASIDGAGGVTLHFPADESAPPEATAMPGGTTALPHAYQLDDAPRFERFFLITADDPIDVQDGLAAVRALAQRDDAADAPLELPAGFTQTSLRLRKPESP
ncbi:MAG TPA: hypothetical protein VLX92_15665 [Kofleriaceae bacterium]|nr:hypothetical protein [Kofleriaceae bacterium]